MSELVWSPDGATLAVGGELGDIVLVDPTGAAPDRVLMRPQDKHVGCHLCWSADGSRLVVVRAGAGLALVDTTSGAVIARRAGSSGPLVRMPGADGYLCVSPRGNPERVSVANLERIASIPAPPGVRAHEMAVAPDG